MFQTIALLVSISWRGLRFFAGLPPLLLFFFGGLWYAVWHFVEHPFPALDENPLLDLVDYHTPTFYGWLVLWYYAAPFVTVMLAGFVLMSVWKVWFESRRGRDFATFGALPTWPLSTHQKAPGIVIGEVHHPVEAREIFNPSWLTIPERGLYTGVAIFGAVGSGKTSACMNPFARQLLGWQAANPQMRAAALVLEVKGDFCLRHPANPGRSRTGKRLHRAGHGRPLAMEPALGLVARFLLAGLHRFQLAQSAIREGQGTLLATSLYQSGPLDHRASPRFPGALGDVATGLPLRHRPGAFRGQDRGSREAERRLEQGNGFSYQTTYCSPNQ